MALNKRNKIGKILDWIFFPLRALFLQDNSKFGLSSLRDQRMRIVSELAKGKILDIGCGPNNYFISNFVNNKDSIGIDIYPYEGVKNIIKDFANLPYDDETFDTITLNAVGGHIPRSKREVEFKEFSRILKKGGLLILTEGEPITQYIHHKWYHFYLKIQGKVDVDTERGMLEDEEFAMPRREILRYMNSYGLELKKEIKIMWRLYSIYVSEKR